MNRSDNVAWIYSDFTKYIIALENHLLVFTQTINETAATTMKPTIMTSIDNPLNIFPPRSTPRRSITETGLILIPMK